MVSAASVFKHWRKASTVSKKPESGQRFHQQAGKGDWNPPCLHSPAEGRHSESAAPRGQIRRELAEIENPLARRLFILAKINHLIHFRVAEYVTLIAAADLTGHYGVGVLLESCLADKLALVERTRRMVRNIIETKMAEKVAA